MSKTRRRTITKVTFSRLGLLAMCGAVLLVAAAPAHGGDSADREAFLRASYKVRVYSGFENGLEGRGGCFEFAESRVLPVEEEPVDAAPTEDAAVHAFSGSTGKRPTPSVKIFLRDDDEPGELPAIVSFVKVNSTSLSLHEFTYRPAKRTLVQRLGDTFEINVSLGTDHQLDPGHYAEQLPSVGLLLERRFR